MNFFVGYPAYMEINYRIHVALLYDEPVFNLVRYPFTNNVKRFYDYFKTHAYF